MKTVIAFLLLSAFLSVSAFDFVTKSGREFKNAGIGKAGPEGLEIILPSGTETVPLEDIPDELLNRLSAKRKARILKLREQKKKQPKVKAKTASASPDKAIPDGVLARMADQQLEGIRGWLTVFYISREPSEDAKRFSVLCETFVRDMKNAFSDRQKAEAFMAFQKKVKENNFSGSLQLKPTQGPMRSYIQPPDASSSSSSKNDAHFVPRGARYYKRSGHAEPVRRP